MACKQGFVHKNTPTRVNISLGIGHYLWQFFYQADTLPRVSLTTIKPNPQALFIMVHRPKKH